jgi:single-strand DNA-binding protein
MTGNVVRAPELSRTGKGNPFTRFRFACSRMPRDGERESETDFVDIEAYGKLAENICLSCQVGSRLVIAGKIRHQRWEAEDGSPRSRYVVLADAAGLSLEFDPHPPADGG